MSCGRLRDNPHVLRQAKRLPNYPGGTKTSDDKRVLFLAKIFAGVEMGLAPLTTIKKLSGWRCENYWKDGGVTYVESFERDFGRIHPTQKGVSQ